MDDGVLDALGCSSEVEVRDWVHVPLGVKHDEAKTVLRGK